MQCHTADYYVTIENNGTLSLPVVLYCYATAACVALLLGHPVLLITSSDGMLQSVPAEAAYVYQVLVGRMWSDNCILIEIVPIVISGPGVFQLHITPNQDNQKRGTFNFSNAGTRAANTGHTFSANHS